MYEDYIVFANRIEKLKFLLPLKSETLDTEKTTSGSNPLSLTEEEIDKCYSFHVEARPPAPKKRRRSRADGNPKGKKKIAQENS